MKKLSVLLLALLCILLVGCEEEVTQESEYYYYAPWIGNQYDREYKEVELMTIPDETVVILADTSLYMFEMHGEYIIAAGYYPHGDRTHTLYVFNKDMNLLWNDHTDSYMDLLAVEEEGFVITKQSGTYRNIYYSFDGFEKAQLEGYLIKDETENVYMNFNPSNLEHGIFMYEIVDHQFSEIWSLDEPGSAKVSDNGKFLVITPGGEEDSLQFSYIDFEGNTTYTESFTYDQIVLDTYSGFVFSEDKTLTIKDNEGTVMFEKTYDNQIMYMSWVSGNRLRVQFDHTFIILDSNFEEVDNSTNYFNIDNFFDGYIIGIDYTNSGVIISRLNDEEEEVAFSIQCRDQEFTVTDNFIYDDGESITIYNHDGELVRESTMTGYIVNDVNGYIVLDVNETSVHVYDESENLVESYEIYDAWGDTKYDNNTIVRSIITSEDGSFEGSKILIFDEFNELHMELESDKDIYMVIDKIDDEFLFLRQRGDNEDEEYYYYLEYISESANSIRSYKILGEDSDEQGYFMLVIINHKLVKIYH